MPGCGSWIVLFDIIAIFVLCGGYGSLTDDARISLPSGLGAIGGILGLLELIIKWRVTIGTNPDFFLTFIAAATLGLVGAILYKWQQGIAGLELLTGSIIPPAMWLYRFYYVQATGGSGWAFLFSPAYFVQVYWWDGFILLAGLLALWEISHRPPSVRT